MSVIDLQREYAEREFIPIIERDAAELLIDTCKAARPTKILEIGTAIGYSGLIMLQASPTSTLTTVDIDEDRLALAEEWFEQAGVKDRVRIICEDASYLLTLLEDRFDFVFLDGPKAHYSSMLPDILRLTRQGGIIFVDDVGYQGLVDNGEYPPHKHRTIVTNMRKFIEDVAALGLAAERYDVGQGVMIIRR